MFRPVVSCLMSTVVGVSSVGVGADEVKAQTLHDDISRHRANVCDYSLDSYYVELMQEICQGAIELERSIAPTRPVYQAPPRRESESVRWTDMGQNMQELYRRGNEIIPGVVAVSGDSDNVYTTRQIADDGSVVYYSRINNDRNFLMRYNETNDSAGQTEVYAKVCSTGYFKGKVTMFTEYGRELETPQVFQVETNDMYPALRALICN